MRPLIAPLIALWLTAGVATAAETPFPYLATDASAATARYAAWTPTGATMQMLEKAGLPRYLDIAPAGLLASIRAVKARRLP